MNGVKKLKDGGRMAIIQNGSSLFNGDAGSGPSEIRRFLFENDMLDSIIELPTDLFYNTGITTYIWIVTTKEAKSGDRKGKVQLIDASLCFSKRRKNIGSKRVDLSEKCIDLILKAYQDFAEKSYSASEDGGNPISVTSKIFNNSSFGYVKACVETATKDKQGNIILRKGNTIPVKGMTDYELIPLGENEDEFLAKNVIPYNPDAYYDDSKKVIGYEIPFVKLFYTFTAPEDPK